MRQHGIEPPLGQEVRYGRLRLLGLPAGLLLHKGLPASLGVRVDAKTVAFMQDSYKL